MPKSGLFTVKLYAICSSGIKIGTLTPSLKPPDSTSSGEFIDFIFNKTFNAFPLPLFVRIIENSLLSFRPKSIGPEIFSLFSLSEKL